MLPVTFYVFPELSSSSIISIQRIDFEVPRRVITSYLKGMQKVMRVWMSTFVLRDDVS